MQGIAVPQGSAIDVATDGATTSVPTQGSAETPGPSTAASTQGAATTPILDIELKVHSSTLGLQQLSVSSGKLAALAHLVGLSKGSEVGHFQVVQAHSQLHSMGNFGGLGHPRGLGAGTMLLHCVLDVEGNSMPSE